MTTIYDIKNDEMDTIHRAMWTGDFETLELLAADYAKRDDMETAWRLKSAARQIKIAHTNTEHEQTKWERDGEHRERETEDRHDAMLERSVDKYEG